MGFLTDDYTIRSFVPAINGKYYLGSRNGLLRSTNGETWERVPGTNGLMVMIAHGSRKLFGANQMAAVAQGCKPGQ